jgi:hypothetical protein
MALQTNDILKAVVCLLEIWLKSVIRDLPENVREEKKTALLVARLLAMSFVIVVAILPEWLF